MEKRHPEQGLEGVPSHQGWDLCWWENCFANDQASVRGCRGYRCNISLSKFSSLSWHKEIFLQSKGVKFNSVHLFLTTMWGYIGFIFPNLFDIKQWSSFNKISQNLGVPWVKTDREKSLLNLHKLIHSKFSWDKDIEKASNCTSHYIISGYSKYWF